MTTKGEGTQRTVSKFFIGNRLLTSILIVALFVALSFALVGLPQFETNDDFTMMAIVSGTAFLDRPDEHMLFSHVFLGMLLKQLYLAVPNIPWYGIYQISVVFISLSIITWLVLGKSKRPITMIAIAFGALLLTGVRPLLLLQFTTTGALAACAGALLLMECLDRWHLRQRAVACGIGAAAMFMLAALVRDASASLVLIIMTMFIVARFLPTPLRQWRKALAQLLAAGAAFAIVFAFSWINEHYYQGEWKDFYPIYRIANTIREYRCYKLTSSLSYSIYKHIGWNHGDADLFLNWYHFDAGTYSVEKVKTLAKLMEYSWTSNFDIGKAVRAFEKLITNPNFYPLLLPALFLIPFINRAKVPFASLVLFSIGILSLCAFSIVWLKLPMRVFACIIIAYTLFLIRYISVSKISNIFQGGLVGGKNTSRTIYATILLAVITPSFVLMSQLHSRLATTAKKEKELIEAVQYLSPKSDQLYVKWAGSLPIPIGPFTNAIEVFQNFKILSIGASSRAAFNMERMKQFGISDVIRQLDKENVFLISTYNYNRLIQQYAAEKYGKQVVFTELPVKPPLFRLFKVEFVTPGTYGAAAGPVIAR